MSTPVRSILLVANPAAGGYSADRFAAIEAELRRRGVAVQTALTQQAGQLARLAETVRDVDAIAIYGGDGTVAEAVAGLHRRADARPALAVIPGGTANVLAWEFDLPSRPADAVELIVAGRRRPLHYALANGRPFFLMVSAGLDAAAVHRVSPTLKRRFGKAAFFVSALAAIRGERLPDVRIEADQGVLAARIAVVSNSACYGGRHLLARTTAADRPGLCLVRIARDDLASLLRVGWTMLLRTKNASSLTREQAISRVRLTADPPLPVQVDGDAFGMTPVNIEPVAEPLAIFTRA